MKLDGARVLVAGATGALGGALVAELSARGARPALAGRDPARLARAAEPYRGAVTLLFGAYDPETCSRAVHGAVDGAGAGLGVLDAVVTAFGTVAFGRTTEVGDEVLTGVVAESPQAGMADYSASKAALGAGPGHLDTGFADRAVASTAPPLPGPGGGDPRQVVTAVADAMEADAELLRTAPDGTPVVERGERRERRAR
ncbi:SDR family NAD(P)-dependent oxidoreductase [Streptomyces sp. AC512_CC834]|uniref:SDR family NAD(P)-dependent oxidoreductase n=1 Tax=Streptomyces sp. AC512_CC834 TaxID=2823691 RepID=UPI001C25AA9A|nr:SDR family NAD(P)-dependent oxidoreductase [Streptomyces sp. AC512_CC834]